MSNDFQVMGTSDAALFTLKIHRGEGMALLAMDWKKGKPPKDFVGFAIEYKEPGGDKFYALKNRLSFGGLDGSVDPNAKSTRLSPIQMFRWVHFPRNANLDGDFLYNVTPVFMNDRDELSYGEPQRAALQLRRETYPGQLNVTFTRGFVSSQAFVDKYGGDKQIKTLLPAKAELGLDFKPTHPKADEALEWMGFEARSAIIEVLDEAIADRTAQVRAVVYDLNEPGIVTRLLKIAKTKLEKGTRLRVIIDDDDKHGLKNAAETIAASRLAKAAGEENVIRQHMGKLQHNKMIVVDGKKVEAAVVGSTNHSWRGYFVQNNNAIILRGRNAVKACMAGFDAYWATKNNSVADFCKSPCATWNDLKLDGIDAQIGFSPRSEENAVLAKIAKDIESTKSSLFYSLAFLYQTKGPIQNAIKKLKKKSKIFSYGISDHLVEGLEGPEAEGIDFQKPDGTVLAIHPEALAGKDVPEPFKSEPVGGGGTRMHHKFVVIDFDKPTARVYMGSYNFSSAADITNGENLLLIRDRRIATSYMVEAVRIFDHHHFRVAQLEAETAQRKLQLRRPPRKAGEHAWWEEFYKDQDKILDRQMFA